MSLDNNKSKSALGNNPLSDLSSTSLGIFNRTDTNPPSQDSMSHNSTSPSLSLDSPNNQESGLKSLDSSFSPLSDRQIDKEKVNLRLPLELNDWLDATVKRSKRLHGHKIPKETLLHAALLFFQHLPLDWDSVQSVDDLQLQLHKLSSLLIQDS